MPSWLLRLIAVAISASSMVGSTGYVLYHPKNPGAPLQPGVVDPVDQQTEPETMPIVAVPTAPPARTARPTLQPTVVLVSRTAAPGPQQAVIVTLPPTVPPRVLVTTRPTPVPTVRLAPGVRATQLPQVTITHQS